MDGTTDQVNTQTSKHIMIVDARMYWLLASNNISVLIQQHFMVEDQQWRDTGWRRLTTDYANHCAPQS